MKLPTEISPAEAGGWLAALGVLSIWLVRALSYSRRFGKFEGRLDERLKALEQGQAAISTKVDTGFREVHGRIDDAHSKFTEHLEATLARQKD